MSSSTQSGHPSRHRSQAAAPPSLHGSAQSHVRLWLLAEAIENEHPIWDSAPCFCLIAKAFSFAWNKNSAACVWAEIIHQYRREPQMRTLILGGLLASAMLVPHLHKPILRLFRRRLLPSLLLRKRMARCGDHRSSSASTSTTIRTRSSAPSAKFCSTSLERSISS